jgi:hypothetical protein
MGIRFWGQSPFGDSPLAGRTEEAAEGVVAGDAAGGRDASGNHRLGTGAKEGTDRGAELDREVVEFVGDDDVVGEAGVELGLLVRELAGDEGDEVVGAGLAEKRGRGRGRGRTRTFHGRTTD